MLKISSLKKMAMNVMVALSSLLVFSGEAFARKGIEAYPLNSLDFSGLVFVVVTLIGVYFGFFLMFTFPCFEHPMKNEEIKRMKKWYIANFVIIFLYLIHALFVLKIGFQLPVASEILNNEVGNGYCMLRLDNGVSQYKEVALEGKKLSMMLFSLLGLTHLAGMIVLTRKNVK
jgi:hypothetical protein